MPAAGIALGSNIEPRLQYLRDAYTWLCTLHEGDQPPLASSIFETEPVDCPPDSAWFLNAVMEIQSSLPPHDLLNHLLAYERSCGRMRSNEQNSSRVIDLDLLYFANVVVASRDLALPHPRLADRLFVLLPLAQICPLLILPGYAQNVSELAREAKAAKILNTGNILSLHHEVDNI